MSEAAISVQVSRLNVGQHRVICPFCADNRKPQHRKQRTMSILVEDDRAIWRCWHCEREGVIRTTETTPNRHTPKQKLEVVKPITKEPLTESDWQWLEEQRGFDREKVEAPLFVCPDYFIPDLQKRVRCIGFAYTSNKKMYAAKLRSMEGKGYISYRACKTLYNADNVDWSEKVIIVEGEMDVLAMQSAGYRNVVSVPNGANAITDASLAFLWEHKDDLKDCPGFIIAIDGDKAGEPFAEEVARRLGRCRCWRLKYPEGCKDANDILKELGADYVRDAVEDAEPWPVQGLYQANEFMGDLYSLYDEGMLRGEKTGWDALDEIYTVVPGMVSIVTGVPGSGKSSWIDALMVNLAERCGWSFAICSFENPPHMHLMKLLELRERLPFFGADRMDKRHIANGMSWLNRHFSMIYSGDGEIESVENILERAKAAVMRYGIKGLVIDPYNFLAQSQTDSETQHVAAILKQIKAFAVAYGVHIFFVAHPQKMKRREDGSISVPTGYDISGSANFWNIADMGVTVHRVEGAQVLIRVWKCRFKWMGSHGDAFLKFDIRTGRYADEYGNDGTVEHKPLVIRQQRSPAEAGPITLH